MIMRAAILLTMSVAATALAQPPSEPKPPESKPADPNPRAAQPADTKQQPPSLDDLLGLPKEKSPAKSRPAAPDPTKNALDRKLTQGEASDQFKQAVQLMGETADRLQSSKDTGLSTQRLQEDILRKLDQVIKAAEQNQKQSKSSRSQQQKDKQQQQPNQSQSQRNPDAKEAAPDTMDPPQGEKANPTPGVAARGAAWGSLPARLRDALLQGNEDKYSSLYQKWTEAYYRRLAEDANR
jgi:hypothetical protein